MVNLNDLAVEIANEEGKKDETNIAQIKEIMHIRRSLAWTGSLLKKLSKMSLKDLAEALYKVG